MNEERDTDARLWHPWLRINRVLRVMPHTRWSAEAWSQVRVEFRQALALRSEIRRAGWFLVAVVMLTGCRGLFDDTYVLWSRYHGPGGNFWKIESEHGQVVWKSSSDLNNRQFCELAIAELRKIDVKLTEDMKKVGRTVGATDYVCLPKGMHP